MFFYDRAEYSHAWRAGEKAMRDTAATASKESMEGTLLWDIIVLTSHVIPQQGGVEHLGLIALI